MSHTWTSTAVLQARPSYLASPDCCRTFGMADSTSHQGVDGGSAEQRSRANSSDRPRASSTGRRKTGTIRDKASAVGASSLSTLVRHINHVLKNDELLKSGNYVPLPEDEAAVFEALKDGILLAKLINWAHPMTVNVDRMHLSKTKMNAFQRLENVAMMLKGAEALGIKLVNISAQDIIDGNKNLVTSIIWQITKKGLLHQVNLVFHPDLKHLMKDGEDARDFIDQDPEQLLLRWVNFQVEKAGSSLVAKNFTDSFSDGICYCFLLPQVAGQHIPDELVQKAHGSRDSSDISSSDRVTLVMEMACAIDCDRFFSVDEVVRGVQSANLAFIAELFNSYPSIVDDVEDESHQQDEDDSLITSLESQLKRTETGNDEAALQGEKTVKEGELPAPLKAGIDTFERALETNAGDSDAVSQVKESLVEELQQLLMEENETEKATTDEMERLKKELQELREAHLKSVENVSTDIVKGIAEVLKTSVDSSALSGEDLESILSKQLQKMSLNDNDLIASLQEEVSQLRKKKMDLMDNYAELKSRYAHLREGVEGTLQGKFDRMKQEKILADRMFSDLNVRHKSLREEISQQQKSFTQRLEQLQAERADLLDQISNLESTNSVLQKKAVEDDDVCEKLRNELQTLKQTYETLLADRLKLAASGTSKQTSVIKKVQLDSETKDLQSRLADLEAVIDRVRVKVDGGDVVSLEEIVESGRAGMLDQEIVLSLPPEPALLHGFLSKRSDERCVGDEYVWRKRYFVLYPATLKFYKGIWKPEDSDADKPPEGIIHLRHVQTVKEVEYNMTLKHHAFQLRIVYGEFDAVLLFHASSDDDRRKWIDTLKDCISMTQTAE